eukprot:m.202595 g.202595  ORF g.202595 m.202595 type:complete len:159 (+) comp21818_c0_seq1:106-582(+)
MPGTITITTPLGLIRLRLRPDAAPVTVDYIVKCVTAGLYNGTSFYRSDFVIQCGLHGSGKSNAFGDLPVNETSQHTRISNTRGTAAIAHFDVPDNGNTEFFINLNANTHLDDVYGGYCVFAEVPQDDTESWKTIDAIATTIASGKQSKVEISRMVAIV